MTAPHPSLLAEIDGHYQIYEILPDMDYWGGWPCYLARAVGFPHDPLPWFAVPKNNPGVANWYNREPLGFTPPSEMVRILPRERARALALLWMRGGKEFEKSEKAGGAVSRILVIRPHLWRGRQIGFDIGWRGIVEAGAHTGNPWGPIYWGNVKDADSLARSLPEYRSHYEFTLSEECERFLRGERIAGDPPDFRGDAR